MLQQIYNGINLKIIFFVACLEPGRDGVGDYTRILAEALTKLGHTITLLALNDQFVTKEIAVKQNIDTFNLEVIRIPACLNESMRFKRAKAWITLYDPEWISLQFVIFSFHKKGLPFNLCNQLKVLVKGRKFHIMFHELWVGMTNDSGKKMILWGWVQKQIIRNLLLKLKPLLIHTQSQIYQAQLTKLGFLTMYLPLFGNIPVINQYSSVAPVDKLPSKDISFVLFGSIHPGAPVETLVNDLANYTKEYNVYVSLKIVGRNGTEQAKWIKIWKSAGFNIEISGELSAENVSEILSNSTFGITTTPIALAEKSGTIAAMKEHGLKVLCVSLPWQLRHSLSFAAPAGIMEYNGYNLNEILNCKFKLPVGSPIKIIAEQLIADFRNAV